MKKFYESVMSSIVDEYNTMRSNLSLMTVFYTIQYFKPKTILEMGFYEGQTFGIMIEAAEPGCELTAIDIEYRMQLFDRYYATSDKITDKKINLLNIDSRNFKSESTFDFINVDTYNEKSEINLRWNDFLHAVDLLSKDGILMLDNYILMETLLSTYLQQDPKIVPFFKDSQALYFHHVDHNANNFLDLFIPQTFPKEFASTFNTDFYGHLVTDIDPVPVFIHNYGCLMRAYCQMVKI